jgi:hypothetical protein
MPRALDRLRLFTPLLLALLAGSSVMYGRQQPPSGAAPKFATPAPQPPLFFREEWRQTTPFDASTNFEPERAVTPTAVTGANLELRLYDPRAREIPANLKNPPTGSIPRDWGGPSCVQLAGYNQNPRPKQVVAGQPTDPPNLWTGVCNSPVAVTLRDRTRFVDLTGLARIRWVTRTSGFHVVRPVIKLADGTWLIGDRAEGSSTRDWIYSEFTVSDLRWLRLDVARVVTTGNFVPNVDLSKVDEVGFADLMPGSGHGPGGWVDVAQIEVYAKAVPRQ